MLDPLIASDPWMLDEANDVSGRTTSGEAVRVVTKRARKDGTLVDVDIVSAPIFVGGEQVAYYGIYTDVGELQERTRELQVALEQLAAQSTESRWRQAQVRLPGQHVARAADAFERDRRFPQVLKQKLFGQVNQDEYLDDILSSADHLLALINDILDLSKVEAGQVELETGLFSLREALERGW